MTYDINTIYTKYKQLTKKQRQQLLAALQSQGINIVKSKHTNMLMPQASNICFSILQRIAGKPSPILC